MTQDTQNKFAAILAAAQAKANITPTFKEPIAKPVISMVMPEIKAIQAEIKVNDTVRYKGADMTANVTKIDNTQFTPVADITFQDGKKEQAYIEDLEFSNMQISAAGEIEEKAKINVVDYSDKAIVLTGETFPIRKDLKALGAIFSYNFKCGAGWMFSKKRFNEVKEQLQLV